MRDVGRGGAGLRRFRDPSVNEPPLLAQVLVEDRRQQRVREANHPVVALDHVRDGGRFERVPLNARPLQARLRARAQRGGDRQRLASGRRECVDPRAHEFFERLGNWERLNRVDVRVENTRQLQREERIPSGPLVDAEQGLAREGPAEPVAQEPMKRARAERSQRQPLHILRTQRVLEPRRLRSVTDPAGEQQGHLVRGEPSQCECERARRGRIEPLDVVDREQERLPLAEELQRITDGHGERALIDGITRCLLHEQRCFECTPPRRRNRRQDIAKDLLEEIA